MNEVLRGTVFHERKVPRSHKFLFPFSCYLLDLDSLRELSRTRWWFGLDSVSLLSLRSRDYFQPETRSVLEKLRERVGVELGSKVDRVVLLTQLRVLGYCFNPVSFFFCYDAVDKLVAVVAEVNNTFGERHCYILTELHGRSVAGAEVYEASHTKKFHVSPFFEREGEYKFRFAFSSDAVVVEIFLQKEGRVHLEAGLRCGREPLSGRAVCRTLLLQPIAGFVGTFLTMPRIMGEAAKLYFKEKLPVVSKPPPLDETTLTIRRPNLMQRLAMRGVRRFLAGLSRGRLTVRLPDGREWRFGEHAAAPSQAVSRDVSLTVRDYRTFSAIAFGHDVGFGEAFVDGHWTTPDLVKLYELVLDNPQVWLTYGTASSLLDRSLNRLRHSLRRNSVRGSRRNIYEHYDLGNEFFQTFLDSRMQYSSGVFQSPSESLEEAQIRKIRCLADLAELDATHHLLEIGCGWGGLAVELAKQVGCRVTAITVSSAQHREATERVKREGVSDLVTVALQDYRKVKGQFDRIISVEMIEAVGHRYFGRFFSACHDLLKSSGLLVIQTITIPDERYDAYRRGCDWIQKYIFPGGCLPSLAVLNEAADASTFNVRSVDSIGLSYAETLARWREQFLEKWPQIKTMGFDERFYRLWQYYLVYCETAFRQKAIDDLQIVFQKARV